MASERNRILELKNYLSSLGIDVNIGKNKARGHKGLFISGHNFYRIDIAKNINEEDTISVILHEFAHFVHYNFDKSLKNLNFVFGELSDDIKEELIQITVQNIPKTFATSLFSKKEQLQTEIKNIADYIKKTDNTFKISQKNYQIESKIKSPIKYLLKYDRIKYHNQIYTINNLNNFDLSEKEIKYIQLKSKQRALKRINSRINRLNKYYNNPSELFARFIDSYYTNPELTNKIAPNAIECLQKSQIKLLEPLAKIFNK